MYYPNLSVPHRLSFAREAIHLAQTDPVLSEALGRFGYTPERLSKGLSLLEEADRYLGHQQLEYGARLSATATVRSLYTQVRGRLRDDRRIAQIALGANQGLLEALKLRGPLERRREWLLVQATHFYREALDNHAVMEALAPHSMTPEVLNERLERVAALSESMEDQQHQRAEARVRTQQRRMSMKELDRWMAQFIGVARQAFRDEPRHLEKLGIEVSIPE